MLQAQKFTSTPREVLAVRITPQNMREAAAWCGGKIVSTKADGSPGPRYIQVDVQNPLSPRQTKAYKGDWLLKAEKGGFKVYLEAAFQQNFVADPLGAGELIETGLEKSKTQTKYKKKRPPKKTAVGDAMKRAQAAAIAKGKTITGPVEVVSMSVIPADEALPGCVIETVSEAPGPGPEKEIQMDAANERQDPAEQKRVDVAVETESQAPDAEPTEAAPEQPAETTSVTVEQSTPTDS